MHFSTLLFILLSINSCISFGSTEEASHSLLTGGKRTRISSEESDSKRVRTTARSSQEQHHSHTSTESSSLSLIARAMKNTNTDHHREWLGGASVADPSALEETQHPKRELTVSTPSITPTSWSASASASAMAQTRGANMSKKGLTTSEEIDSNPQASQLTPRAHGNTNPWDVDLTADAPPTPSDPFNPRMNTHAPHPDESKESVKYTAKNHSTGLTNAHAPGPGRSEKTIAQQSSHAWKLVWSAP